jgi:hypothetical protein
VFLSKNQLMHILFVIEASPAKRIACLLVDPLFIDQSGKDAIGNWRTKAQGKRVDFLKKLPTRN